MRLLLNGTPMLLRRTGIGRYCWKLTQTLVAEADALGVERVGIFDGARILGPEEFAAEDARRDATEPPPGRRRNFIKRCIPPVCRSVLRSGRSAARSFQLALHVRRDWSLFHETNYVAPRVRLPLATTVHDMTYLRHPDYLPSDTVQWLRDRLGPTLARARAIITDSEFTRRELLELCPKVQPLRVHAVHLGVDTREFRPQTPDRLAEVRGRYRLPPQFLLYLGTLEPRKNLQGLLAAYARLPRERRREFPLVLAGMSGWNEWYFRDELHRLMAEGTVRHLDYVPQADVPALFGAATLFCFPSLYEGFGLPPLEAAACGTPVLASHAASLPEVMGDAAEYVDPHSVESIAVGMSRLLDDEARRGQLARLGPEHAARFTWSACARNTVAAFRAAA